MKGFNLCFILSYFTGIFSNSKERLHRVLEKCIKTPFKHYFVEVLTFKTLQFPPRLYFDTTVINQDNLKVPTSQTNIINSIWNVKLAMDGPTDYICYVQWPITQHSNNNNA